MARPRKQPINDDEDFQSKNFMTPEAQESYLISESMRLVEKRLRDGTASSQETTHFLQLGSKRNQLQISKLEAENELLRAKTEEIASRKKTEELYTEALDAMRKYSGNSEDEDYDDDY